MRKFLSTLLLLTATASAASIQGADGVSVDVNNPKRVVALNGTTLEMIYLLGKQNSVVARDNSGTYPKNDIASVGHWAKLPAEGIIALKPDLVIGTADNLAITALNRTTIKQLRDAGVPVLILPASDQGGVAGVKKRLNILGQVYGVSKTKIDKLTGKIDQTVKKIAAQRPSKAPKTIFLYAHGPTDASIYGTKGGANGLIELAGGQNMATFEKRKSLTSEALVAMNPDVIIMLDRGLAAVDGLEGALQLPGVALTNAGKNKRIYTVDNSIRWFGPRFADFALKLAEQWRADANKVDLNKADSNKSDK